MLTYQKNKVPFDDTTPSTPQINPKIHQISKEQYDMILRQTRTILFQMDFQKDKFFLSSFISEILSGTYDNRKLSSIFREDNIVHQNDKELFDEFYQAIFNRMSETQSVNLRLLGKDENFRWYKISAFAEELQDKKLKVSGSIIDVNDEMNLRESLQYRAEYDTVTEIYNRETFYIKTRNILEKQSNQAHAIVRLDIDRFKTVNELFGIAEGDRVLHFLGQLIKNSIQKEESCARMDNDVFCMCVCRSEKEILELMKHVNEKLNAYQLDFNFVLSTGIYYFLNYDGQPVNILCDRAGLAQKTVKGNYIKRSAFYEDCMGQELSREHYIIGGMNRAIEKKEFAMFLQPKFDIESETIVGSEALVRWFHPQEGMILPGDFIPLFEKNGFIIKLDEYMWEQACITLRSWINRGLKPMPVSVNVSRVHIYDTTLCQKLSALVEKYDLEPKMLELEITESAYVENPKYLYEAMRQLQKQGFIFLMDDFGSGYSSLSMLKDIPVDILKIDLNFLQESKRGERGEPILEATIQMAKSLWFPIIAEGVETKEQAAFLLKAGCTKAQGFYYDRPLSIEDFEKKYFP